MIGSLVRWFRRPTATKRSRRGVASAPRFTPRLEVLEGRALPAVSFGGGVVGSVTAQAALLGGLPGTETGLLGSKVIASGGSNALGGGSEVTLFGVSKPAASGGLGAQNSGSEVTLFGVKAGSIGAGDGLSGGSEVTLFGGSKPATNGGSNVLGGGSEVTLLGGSKLGIAPGGSIALSGGSEVTLFGVKARTIGAGDGLSGGTGVTLLGSKPSVAGGQN